MGYEREKAAQVSEEKRKQLMSEFTDLCKPLNEWLQNNFCPHTKIIIESSYAEIVKGFIGIPFEVKD